MIGYHVAINKNKIGVFVGNCMEHVGHAHVASTDGKVTGFKTLDRVQVT